MGIAASVAPAAAACHRYPRLRLGAIMGERCGGLAYRKRSALQTNLERGRLAPQCCGEGVARCRRAGGGVCPTSRLPQCLL